jgi:hypothetical protein
MQNTAKASFQENLFSYDYNEYNSWYNGDKILIDSLLKVCGNLGQERITYYNQSTQGYPEVKYAIHLVRDKGFDLEYIFYEKYRLSLRYFYELIGKDNPDAIRYLTAYSRLREVFFRGFFP